MEALKGSLQAAFRGQADDQDDRPACPADNHVDSPGASTNSSERKKGLNSPRDSATEFPCFDEDSEGGHVAWRGQFPLKYGGKIVMSLTATASFTIAICPDSQMQGEEGESSPSSGRAPYLGVRVNRKSVELVYSSGEPDNFCILSSCFDEQAGYRECQRATYWLSFDPWAATVKFGQGSPYTENLLLFCSLPLADNDAKLEKALEAFFRSLERSGTSLQLQGYHGPPIAEASIFQQPLLLERSHKMGWIFMDSEPLVLDPSPRLMPNKAMLLSDLGRTDVTFRADLSRNGQVVAKKILQPALTLEAFSNELDVSLASAIGYSLKTKGALLHDLLTVKRRRLGVPDREVRLTVELAPALGNSPGPGTTLEILPPGHSGPALCNARTHGVLKVLHGNMDVSFYNNDLEFEDVNCPVDEVDLSQGDAFWFSPSWYQTQAMTCVSASYCCYIISRVYDDQDDVRSPFFTSKDLRGRMCKRYPKADCNFLELVPAVCQELREALAENPEVLEDTPSETEELDRNASLRTEAWVEDAGQGSSEPAAPHVEAFSRAGEGCEFASEIASIPETDTSTDGWRSKACWLSGMPDTVKPALTPIKERQFKVHVPEYDDHPSRNLVHLWP